MILLGAAAGDILGSPYEWSSWRGAPEEIPLFSRRARATDDTVLTCAVAHALVKARREDGAVDEERFTALVGPTIRAFALAHPGAGYGGRFKRWMHAPDDSTYKSFGNGSAMRVSACAWAARSDKEALRLAQISAMPTHGHPAGILGAQATVLAIRRLREGQEGRERLLREWQEQFEKVLGRLPDVARLRAPIRFDVTCRGTVGLAVSIALSERNYENVIRRAVARGGDCDTVAAIAGSIAAAAHPVPDAIATKVMAILPEDLRSAVIEFERAFGPNREDGAPSLDKAH